jgi:hypothetical protein
LVKARCAKKSRQSIAWLSAYSQVESGMILEFLWLRFDVSGKDILACIFALVLTFVTTRIESQRGPVFLLLRSRFQFNQRYEFGVGATLASDAEKPSFFHSMNPSERCPSIAAQKLRSGFEITRNDRDYVTEVAQRNSILYF